MLLGWTVSRTHCFISEANLWGSLDRSQRSFRVHLQGETNKGLRSCLSREGLTRSSATWLPGVSKLNVPRTDLLLLPSSLVLPHHARVRKRQ